MPLNPRLQGGEGMSFGSRPRVNVIYEHPLANFDSFDDQTREDLAWGGQLDACENRVAEPWVPSDASITGRWKVIEDEYPIAHGSSGYHKWTPDEHPPTGAAQ